jgi:hypothetical protein
VTSGSRPVQLEVGSPSPAAGTSPDAIAPTTVPMKKGVSREATPNTRVAGRCTGPGSAWRKAKPEPRRTIPSAARDSGM